MFQETPGKGSDTMAVTDHPLKRLVSLFINDFAAWLLNSPVRDARPLNVELPSDIFITDQVFRITLADGRDLVLHIEFQGRRSQTPMPWRMLEYMPRLAVTYRLPLWSVVFYVGAGAGADDMGHHAIQGPAAVAPLVWHDQVIHLWQMPAEDLLALDQPVLLALVGQTRLDQPAVVLPAVVARLRQVPDAEARGRLLTALLALLPQEEIVAMVEKLLEDERLLLDTPYLRRIREEGREEGLLVARRRSIVDVLTIRFAPPAAAVQQVTQYVETVTEAAALERLLDAAVRSASLAEFQAAMTREA
jgi:predicted transposase YdaD